MGPWRTHRIAEVRLAQIPPGLDGSLLLQVLESIFQDWNGDYTEL